MFKQIKTLLRVTALVILLPSMLTAWDSRVRCPDVPARGELNVLTINLLYSESKDRSARFEILSSFLQDKAEQGDPVDLILLQEVAGGFLSGTQNTSHDLKRMLAEKGLDYNLRYCPVNDQIGLLSEGIAILSRCRILVTFVKPLSPVWETPEEGFDVPLKRKAMMIRIRVPQVGNINVFNTHLCAYCDGNELRTQSDDLLAFASAVRRLLFWDRSPAILGGDFNMNLENADGETIYNNILSFGFEDTFAVIHACGSCCTGSNDDEGCTYGVNGNPYTEDAPVRIDYIFSKKLDVLNSTVVFNDTPQWVSDHSGVLTKFAVQKKR